MDNLTAKIIELSSGVYVIPATTNVGVITNENPSSTDSSVEVYLIDSGCTEIDGEYVLDVLKAFFEQLGQSFTLKAIITTHGHADHCGAHNFLKEEKFFEWLFFKSNFRLTKNILMIYLDVAYPY